MPSSPPTEAPAAVFICECDDDMRSACKGLAFFRKYEGKSYCVLHYPGKDKSTPFSEVLKKKLAAQDFDFQGVWFVDDIDFSNFQFTKEADFGHAIFTGLADFTSATFNARASFAYASFSKADFKFATFDGMGSFRSATFSALASFHSARFAKASFRYAQFGTAALPERSTSPVAYFTSTTFAADVAFEGAAFGTAADFTSATFNGAAFFNSVTFSAAAYFHSATFNAAADFTSATFSTLALFDSVTFKDYARFAGSDDKPVFVDDSSLSLQFAKIEKPERFLFHTVKLRPHWFVNVDARKFEFTSVGWHWYNHHWYNFKIRGKLKRQLSEKAIPSYILLAVACRRLAVNAEENNLYWRASSFRYLAMNVERLDTGRGFALWTVDWWYWLASGFGERAGRAFLVLLGVLVLFAALYVGLGYPNWETKVAPEKAAAAEAPREELTGRQQWSSALVYSAGVMTLQKPEPRPATDAAQAVVMLETILGPVQAALLALAIRRKFMR